ncbi:transposase [Legionella israelensis]|uniref:IS66 family insertion sequence element accessory protein TnpB n=1 Tax=Legionella israelensis TaxID=454 RepID=UPI000E055587|nr:IS66 family insertion sequence element accessory protein TnpB [Legionella israelensis]STX57433.1 transposase [Legionella israelensis]
MLRLPETTAIYVATTPVDFRKAINGLAAMVIEEFESPANDGSVYVFYNRSRDRVKCLFWDKNGFVLYHKRLERGKFKMEKTSTQLEAITHNSWTGCWRGLNLS